MKRLGLRIITTCLLLGLAGCTSSSGSGRLSVDRPVAKPIDFNQPTTPQAAEKAYPAGDRTDQALQAVAARGQQVVAAGFDQSDNLSRPLFVSSDDGGKNWTRRQLSRDSLDRSGVSEGATNLAAGPSGFVATGYGYAGPVIWLSQDGHEWRRLPDNPKVLSPTDSISAITATATGFVMVGSSDLGDRHLVYWQSTDGTTWRRTDGPSIGLKPTVPGEVSANAIAANGNTVVVSGNLMTATNAKQTDRLQYWYSTNGGKAFRAAAVRGSIATEYRIYNQALAVGAGKFVALIQGTGYDDDNQQSWDGVIVEGGATGASWQVAATPWVLGSTFQEFPGTLVRTAKDWLATTQVSTGTVDTTVAVGPTWQQLADGTDQASQHGRGDQLVSATVAIGNEAVMVGSNNRSGSIEPAVWRYDGSRVSSIALPAEVSAGRPSSAVSRLVGSGRGLVAVGDISSAPTGWTRDGAGWQATTLPGRKNGQSLSLSDAAATADGRVVAVGTKQLPIGRGAVVWMRTTDGKWSEAVSPVFGIGAKSPFGGPSAEAVAVGPGGWVVVGQRHDGDLHDDAWTAYSKDGKTWVEGVGGKVLPDTPDKDTRRTRSQNLRSVGTDAAVMATVLAVGSRFVAGGDRGDGKPAVWLSPNGNDWNTVVQLPLAKGVHSADVTELGRIGNTLVAIGHYDRKDGDTEGGWVSWTSANGGLTWSASSIAVPSRAAAGTLVNVPNGIVALGNSGGRTNLDAAAWFSRDGQSWKAIAVPGERAKGPGRQGLVSGVVDGGKLLVAAFDVPPAGGGYYTLEMDLPK